MKQNRNINVLIVDDEEFACLNLQKTITEYIDAGINVVGHACNTAEAELKILEHKPDIVFFDVEMPSENAFNFLERLKPINFEIIFVTAYDEYAIKAFKLNAVDYILKPICIEEVSEAIKKAKERLVFKRLSTEKYNNTISAIKQDKIKLKLNNGDHEIVEFRNIIYLEAKGSYTLIHFYAGTNCEQNTLLSNMLNEYEDLLPADRFFRIHRSYLINYEHLKKILHKDNFSVIMKNHVQLPVSRRRMPALMSIFKNSTAE